MPTKTKHERFLYAEEQAARHLGNYNEEVERGAVKLRLRVWRRPSAGLIGRTTYLGEARSEGLRRPCRACRPPPLRAHKARGFPRARTPP